MKPEFLVTGATGFVGRRLVERLVAMGADVRVLVRQPEKLPTHLSSACEVIVGDLDKPASLEAAVAGVDVIFHCAANVRTWDKWPAYEAANIRGVESLARAVVRCNPGLQRFIHLSSVDVYGFPVEPADETAILDKVDYPYGESKRQGELRLRQIAEVHGIPYTILRPTNIIGPRSPFIERIGNELMSGLMLTIDGGGVHAGLLHVDNLIDYMHWAAFSELSVNEIFNVRDRCEVSWGRFIDDLRVLIGGRGWVIDLPFIVADTAAHALAMPYRALRLTGEPMLHPLIVRIFGRTCGHSADKLWSISNMEARVSYEQGMAESAAWFLDGKVRGP
ncbi:MAG: NAD(P)-dependent oxidoreductase [Sterolibacterium sp.]|nr:NAD(P)-dependent oxidoreductase [Sterolibacterium sp.]